MRLQEVKIFVDELGCVWIGPIFQEIADNIQNLGVRVPSYLRFDGAHDGNALFTSGNKDEPDPSWCEMPPEKFEQYLRLYGVKLKLKVSDLKTE